MTTHPNPGLRVFSKLLCAATLFLIFAGAMVNSTGSGLAVPDWPTSYGNWFFVPMVGGVFYEHGHRLIAEAVGLMTVVLAIWIKLKDTRKWLHVLGFVAVAAVIIQGVLGGLTVLYYLPTPISVMHGVLAQSFLILTVVIAYDLSKERNDRLDANGLDSTCSKLIKPAVIFGLLIYLQLILGAIMRHSGAGLAIYDFPTMAGTWWPTLNEGMLFTINDWRFENNLDPVNMTQVTLHLIHRIGAAVILVYLIFLNINAFKNGKLTPRLKNTVLLIDLLVAIQIILGIMTVLTGKHPHVTSTHVACGALTLSLSAILVLRAMPARLSDMKK